MIKTVAITGANGFIGKHIVRRLLSHQLTVRALSRSRQSSSDSRLTWISGSLDDLDSLAALVQGADAVIHCAGQVRGSTRDSFYHCNVTGSTNLMQVARRSDSCQRFLFLSSLAARCPHLSWYAQSKYDAEQALMAMASPLSLSIFRPTAVYGPGDKELKPVFDWLLRGVLPLPGSADAQLSFLHVTDLADAVCQWLFSEHPPSLPCEVCDGLPSGYTWRRVQEIGASLRHAPVRMVKIPLPLLRQVARLSCLISRLKKTDPMLTLSKIGELTYDDWSASNVQLTQSLDWTPRVSLERALRERLF